MSEDIAEEFIFDENFANDIRQMLARIKHNMRKEGKESGGDTLMRWCGMEANNTLDKRIEELEKQLRDEKNDDK